MQVHEEGKIEDGRHPAILTEKAWSEWWIEIMAHLT